VEAAPGYSVEMLLIEHRRLFADLAGSAGLAATIADGGQRSGRRFAVDVCSGP
jgi:hypothetical protein